MLNTTKDICKVATCSYCEYTNIYVYRADFGFLQSCKECGMSLNKAGA